MDSRTGQTRPASPPAWNNATTMISILRVTLTAFLRWTILLFLLFLLYLASVGEFTPTAVELAVAPYRYSIVDWELSHLPDKWVRRLEGSLAGIVAGKPRTREESLHEAQDFFQLATELQSVERKLRFPEAAHDSSAPVPNPDSEDTAALTERRKAIWLQKARMQGTVEETVESYVTDAIAREGLGTWAGIMPPVDVVLTSSPHLLVISPRERITRDAEFLLEPGLFGDGKDALEAQVERLDAEVSAYVANTGGVALYPAVIADGYGLRNAMEIAAHEWLHAWLFFRPLGRNFWDSGEMVSLNETVATIAGKELGDMAYSALTGSPSDPPPSEAAPPRTGDAEPPQFDFRAEMQETRKRVDQLLAAGEVEEAEAYMEERRKLFVAHGYLLRKLNQAYFAFHGTYATGAASVSPIGGQVQELRSKSESLGDFLRTVAEFGTYEEFVGHLEGLDRVTPEPRSGSLTTRAGPWIAPSPRCRLEGRAVPGFPGPSAGTTAGPTR